ncbi:HipA domain-containing protein [Desulfocapsa sulfexigens DSM 10523]|uniref:HipA domain-containing protein n=1 Tax=Desulfocapsa sulfexigens (strain DSM 10523 / SB164P1) TaxID=1167006 RepID=M1P698_DESSD|nr:type II toxin-antitoxin system HipA family toxin [Desulfocapsa sulfexigens]AGF77227.1 HipA domain-containing protein [Desulfocapsa sulfexigens DSM 10523]
MSNLTVYWDQQIVGTISRHPKGEITFQYAAEWLKNSGRQISLSLPCQEERFSPGVSTAFFENLFPESDARTILAFNHRFDKKDTFAFLENFGEDCAGALSIIPESGDIPPHSSKYRCIDVELQKALQAIESDPGKHKLYPELANARLSIAGAQDKLPVYYEKGSFSLPENSASPTTHIIKPASPYFHDIQRNEVFCMDLARQAGLSVPHSELYTFAGYELFLIERYDRFHSENKVKRVHQEDFCQAMGLPFHKKYQEQGGPGFLHCRELAEEHLSADISVVKQKLTAVMTFNFLIGNNDAHGKNFSIIHKDTITLAPFYDLVSTQVYPNLDRKLAMAIGNTYRHDRVNQGAFVKLSKDMKLRPEKVFEIITATAQKIGKIYEKVLAIHEKQYGKAVIYSDLHTVLLTNLARIQEIMRN